jgi:serine-type D-Ala-D-Ala carboxypeptidase
VKRRPEQLAELSAFVEDRVRSGEFSGVTAAVGDGKSILWRASAGQARARPATPARWTTRWDLASLTKPQAATLALVLDGLGRLPLSLRVGDVFESVAPTMERVRLSALLRHRSGLIAWTPLYARAANTREALALLLGGTLRTERPGRVLYSDLGYVLWSAAAEWALGETLELLLQRHVWAPLGMRGACGPPGRAADVADASLDNSREVEMAAEQGFRVAAVARPRRGAAQDGNARFLGGIPGHAGAFGTVEDMVALAGEWLSPGRVLSREQVREALGGGGEYALGWARRRIHGTAGPALGTRAFGLVGSTGTSLWMDPVRRRAYVWLGHRTSWADLKSIRRRFHGLAAEALG